MKLVIVESPSKTATIKQYLGKEFVVDASKGHIRDIKNEGIDNLGLDFNNNLKPIYEIIPTQYNTIKKLKQEASEASLIYLATDPDREGEAISWHLSEILKGTNAKIKRIEFNEITKSAVTNAIDNPRDINYDLVSSQETRKIIDRIIGYKLSKFVKKTVGGNAAGRVQSVVLKLIIKRDDEVNSYIPKKYYEIDATLSDSTKLKLYNKEKKQVLQIQSLEEAKEIYSKLTDKFIVIDVTTTSKKELSQPPFKTPSLQTAAFNKFNMSVSRLMSIAQELYEGINVNGNHIPFITYMRTDSTRLSDEFKYKLKNHILTEFGEEYFLGYAREEKTKSTDQLGHEAIRPVDLSMTPEKAKEILSKDQYNIYTLIYERTLASMMKDALYKVTTTSYINGGYLFKESFEELVFDGFKKAQTKKEKEKQPIIHELNKTYNSSNIEIIDKETEGPKRYTEGSLVKEMETSGIGRPSTYASTIKLLKDHGYIKIEKKEVVPTDDGRRVSKVLDENYNMIIDVDYTARMEDTLDDIASGKTSEEDIVNHFYKGFTKIMENVDKNFKPLETGEVCPICGSPLVYKGSKNGTFIGCNNYPTCTFTKSLPKEEPKELPHIECPMCHEGHLVERKFKGKKFYGCSNYPTCGFTTSSLYKIKKIK